MKVLKYNMDNKDTLVKTIEDNLSNMFVNEYDKVNTARLSVNDYLKDIEIEFEYNYNNFCIDFMNNSKKLINKISDEQITQLDSNIFVSEVLSYMIKNKIYENVQNPKKRANLIIEHELKKRLINR